ncbi:MAG: FAD-binding oxidoreductase [Gemmatimonadota bacterium]
MTEPAARLLGALGEIAGPGAVRAGAAADAVHGVLPAAVVTPPDAAGVAAVLARCSAEGWAVEPAGAAGRTAWGRPPARVDVLLSTRALAAVEDYVPADLVATAGAGVPLGGLAERLTAARQWLPLDAPGGGASSVGAVFAQGSAGALRATYGAPRDLALGLEVATGDGRLLALGGRVVKNVAGYDLVRLVVGSQGTLGVITRVHLRLRPLPAADGTLDLRAASAGAAVGAALAVREAVPVAALEVLGPGLRVGGEAADGWRLLVRLHGNAPAVAELRERALAAAAACDARPAPGGASSGPCGAPSQVGADRVWADVALLGAAAPLFLRLAGPPAALERTLRLAARCADAVGMAGGNGSHAPGRSGAGGPSGLAGHAGTGVVRLWGAVPEDAPERLAGVLADVRASLAGQGGSLTVARAPAPLAARLDLFPDPGPAGRLMRELRQTFDPAGILSAGRWVV